MTTKTDTQIVKLEEFRELGLQSYQKNGFERALILAEATAGLEKTLTPEVMKSFMNLQGKNYGFKTDKIYDEQTVKNCIIEAVMLGVLPVGNQFNIIAKNTYLTKEGVGCLLKDIPDFYYEITPGIPRISGSSAVIEMKIMWTINGVEKSQSITFPVKVNSFMGPDAVIGKATRKARKWLLDTVTGSEVPYGDITETTEGTAEVLSSKMNGADVSDDEEDSAPEEPVKEQTKPDDKSKEGDETNKVTPPHEKPSPEGKVPEFYRKKIETKGGSGEGSLFPGENHAAGSGL